MEPKVIGEYLRKLRNNKKLTLDQVAESVGYSKGYLSNIENGRRGVPSPEILMKLSIPLEVEYEELMIKAGHWRKSYTDKDSYIDLSYSIDLKNKIITILKAIADDDGHFTERLHDEIFELFGSWLNLNHRSAPGFDEFYKYDYLPREDKEEYWGNDHLKEIHEKFNNVYNYTTIKHALNDYQGYQSLEDVLQNLILIAHNQEIEISEPMMPLSHIELSNILPDQSVIVLYNDKPLSTSDRHRLLGMLDVISKYPDEK